MNNATDPLECRAPRLGEAPAEIGGVRRWVVFLCVGALLGSLLHQVVLPAARATEGTSSEEGGISLRNEMMQMEFARDGRLILWKIAAGDRGGPEETWYSLVDSEALSGQSIRPLSIALTNREGTLEFVEFGPVREGVRERSDIVEFISRPRNDGLVVKKRVQIDGEGYALNLRIAVSGQDGGTAAEAPFPRIGVLLGPGLGRAPSRRPGLVREGRDHRVNGVVLREGHGLTLDWLPPRIPYTGNADVGIRFERVAFFNAESIVLLHPRTADGLVRGTVNGYVGAEELLTDVSAEDIQYYPTIRYLSAPLENLGTTGADLQFDIIAAPKKSFSRVAADRGLDGIFYHHLWGWMAGLCVLLEGFLVLLSGATGDWGISLILFAVLIRIVGMPLTLYGARKQREVKIAMETVGPLAKEIKLDYRDDPEALNEKMLELYKVHGVGPSAHFKGCLPIFFQIPFLIALFQILLYSPQLQEESFLWIGDLSLADQVVSWGVNIPWLGSYLNVLPLCMFVVQVLIALATRQRLDENQRFFAVTRRDLALPAVMALLFYPFPAGCLLFWTTGNVVQLAEQLWIARS